MDQAQRFREAAATHNQDRVVGAWRYPKALHAEALAYDAEQRAAGRSLRSISSELGISAPTLIRWRKEAESPSPLQPIRLITDSAAEESLTLVTPSGYRLEGLSPASAAALLRELS